MSTPEHHICKRLLTCHFKTMAINLDFSSIQFDLFFYCVFNNVHSRKGALHKQQHLYSYVEQF